MKIAILTDRVNSYRKPMAQSLQRLFRKVGVHSEIISDGISLLPSHGTHLCRTNSAHGIGPKMKRTLSSLLSWRRYKRQLRRLRDFDCVVIVDHVPSAYYGSFFDDQRLRNDLGDIPIVLYDLIHLCSTPYWIRALHTEDAKNGVPAGRHFGLDRYDFHLCISDCPNAANGIRCDASLRVGIDLTDDSLMVRPKDTFSAIIDFERPDKARDRAIQVLACEQANVSYHVLSGTYDLMEIRRIYSQSSVYFVAHYESFGLPILENQACGNYVFTPDPAWCRAHWIAKSEGCANPLTPNFIVYESDCDSLARDLRRLKSDYSPDKVRETLSREQPWFLYGDLLAVERFLNMLTNRTISSSSHLGRASLRDLANLYCGISIQSVRGV